MKRSDFVYVYFLKLFDCMNGPLKAAYDRYLSLDQDPVTRDQIINLVNQGKTAELEDRLLKTLSFGTAGLRAEMGGGFNRMNKLTVIQASQGLASYLLESNPSKTAKMSVVVGYDHRYNSKDFAQITVKSMLDRGIQVYLFSDITPTPFVPFAIGLLGCQAGVMVTASHNPKQDNGYKVYWGNGCQIVPPVDKHIADHIAKPENQNPWSLEVWNPAKAISGQVVQDPLDRVYKAYYAKLATKKRWSLSTTNPTSQFKIVYTAMHGVGYTFSKEAAKVFGLPEMIPVTEQIKPDPDFPTVTYPNPEEGKEALDLAIATANKAGATIILANDPDADRLAVAERQVDGSWQVLTGNQIGALLAYYILERERQVSPTSKMAMLTTLVSSKLLERMAAKEGFHFASTLTGFKYLGNASKDLESQGYTVPFAYEEAIGFMVYDLVRDKDGVSALAVFSEMAFWLHHDRKLRLTQYLDEIYQKYGCHVTYNGYVVIPSPNDRAKVFDRLRRADFSGTEKSSAGPVLKVQDFSPQQMIQFNFENCWVIVRASGTEPKVKFYSEMCNDAGTSDEIRKKLAAFIDSEIVKKYLS